MTAYAPIGAISFPFKKEDIKDVNILDDPLIKSLAEKYERSPAQVILNWHLKHRGHVIIPKTSKISRLHENLNVSDFNLTEEEYNSIDGLDKNMRFYNTKYFNPTVWGKIPMFD